MEEIEAKTLPPDLIDAFLVTSTSFLSNSPATDIVNGILEILFENSLKIEYNCEFLIPENRVVEFLYNILASPPVFTFTSTSEIVTKALDVFANLALLEPWQISLPTHPSCSLIPLFVSLVVQSRHATIRSIAVSVFD